MPAQTETRSLHRPSIPALNKRVIATSAGNVFGGNEVSSSFRPEEFIMIIDVVM